MSTKIRGHPGSNQGPLDLQSNALPLSYIPTNLALYYTGLYLKDRTAVVLLGAIMISHFFSLLLKWVESILAI